MKKALLLLLVILFLGAWIGEKMVQDPGYVLVSYNSTTIETSLWVLLVIGLASFLLAHLLLRLLSRARIPSAQLRHWSDRRALRNAHSKTLKGLQALAEGSWWKAQRYLGQAAPRAELPLVNYLAAARAAHEQGDEKAADAFLLQARTRSPEAAMAVDLTQAQLQHERGQFAACRDTLLALRRQAPKHTQVLRLLQDSLVQLGDWHALAGLIPDLRQHQAIPEERLQELELCSHRELLRLSLSELPAETDNPTRVQALNRAWQAIPNRLSDDESLVCAYVAQLVALGEEARAEIFVRDQLKRGWSETLVRLYGRLQGENAHKQLESAKKWLKDHPDSADLYLTLGRLSMRNEHWGKAIGYFEQSIALHPSTDAYGELCRLLQHLGEHAKVATLLQEGLLATGSGLPSLPMPDKTTAVSA
jgi:HemY protein